MGILNTTPDSFSDGGQFSSVENAIARAKQMESEGADIIDIGGESTGPGSTDVSEEKELKRVIPIMEAVSQVVSLPISIDTYKSRVADEACKCGATIINDVTSMRADPEIANIAAKHDAYLILMYAKDDSPRTSNDEKHYDDVIATISEFLFMRAEVALKSGVKREKIILDPGMGAFISSDPKYSFEVIARLGELTKLGYPILVGPSRKSFLGGKVNERLHRSMAAVSACVMNGANIVRVHDVREVRETVGVACRSILK